MGLVVVRNGERNRKMLRSGSRAVQVSEQCISRFSCIMAWDTRALPGGRRWYPSYFPDKTASLRTTTISGL